MATIAQNNAEAVAIMLWTDMRGMACEADFHPTWGNLLWDGFPIQPSPGV